MPPGATCGVGAGVVAGPAGFGDAPMILAIAAASEFTKPRVVRPELSAEMIASPMVIAAEPSLSVVPSIA